MEYQRFRLASIPGSTKHFARSALVLVANLALCPTGRVALAFVAVRSAYLDSADVRHMAIDRLALSGRCLRAGIQSHGHAGRRAGCVRSEEHTSELQSLLRFSYAVFCLKKKNEISQLYILYQFNATPKL